MLSKIRVVRQDTTPGPCSMVYSKRVSVSHATVLFPIKINHVFFASYVPLPKSSNADRVRSNADIFDFALTAEEMQKLDSMDKGRDGSVSWNPVNAV